MMAAAITIMAMRRANTHKSIRRNPSMTPAIQIRAWAEAMLTDERSESRAAARGLLLLADEIERLWEANRTAFANDIGAALAQRLGTD